MLKQVQDNRFRIVGDNSLSLTCYWYAHTNKSIVPIGMEQDNNYQRLRCVQT